MKHIPEKKKKENGNQLLWKSETILNYTWTNNDLTIQLITS